MATEALMERARTGLEGLGFRIVRDGPGELIGIRRRWHWDCLAVRLTMVAVVSRVGVLDAARIETDRERIARDAKALDPALLPRGFQSGVAVLPLYVADRIDETARTRILERPARRWAYFYVPAALDSASGKAVVLERTPFWGWLFFGKFRFVARRVLAPDTAPGREPVSLAGLALAALVAVMILGSIADAASLIRNW